MNPQPSWRKPAGIFLILALILIWCVIVASLASWISYWPALVQGLFYLVFGVIWILPLKPLLRWMELGKWRE